MPILYTWLHVLVKAHNFKSYAAIAAYYVYHLGHTDDSTGCIGGISGRMNRGESSAGLELLLWIRKRYSGANTGTSFAAGFKECWGRTVPEFAPYFCVIDR